MLVGVPAPGHRAQAEPGHDQAAPAESSLLHAANLTGARIGHRRRGRPRRAAGSAAVRPPTVTAVPSSTPCPTAAPAMAGGADA